MKAYRQAYSEGYSNGYHDGEEEAMDRMEKRPCPHTPTYDGPDKVHCSCGIDRQSDPSHSAEERFWEHVREAFYEEQDELLGDAAYSLRVALRDITAAAQAAIAKLLKASWELPEKAQPPGYRPRPAGSIEAGADALDREKEVDIDTKEEEEWNQVDITASGYEFICPWCDRLNEIVETAEEVECGACEHVAEVSGIEHAIWRGQGGRVVGRVGKKIPKEERLAEWG